MNALAERFRGAILKRVLPEPTYVVASSDEARADHGLQEIPLALSGDMSNCDLTGATGRPDEAEVPMDHGGTREPIDKEVRFLVPIEKADSPQRVTYGVVLEPDSEDLQGDVMTAEDIEKAAYDWMERSQHGGHMHADRVEGARVVESYIAPCDIPVETAEGTETIAKGSWVLAMRWPPEIWESIQKGDLTGYSVGGTGVRLEIEKHGSHDQSSHGNWVKGGYRGNPAKDGAAAAGGGTPADQGSTAARADASGKAGKFKVRITEASGDIKDARYRYIWSAWLDDKMLGKGHAFIPEQAIERAQELVDPEEIDDMKIDYKGTDWATMTADEESWYDRHSPQEPYAKSSVEKSLADAVREGLRDAVAKHGSGDQSPHGNWARSKTLGMVSIPEDDDTEARPEDEERDEELRRARAGGKKHTTRDGVQIEGQPKVQRPKNSEMFASADGRVQMNYGEWKWTAAGQSRGVAKPPKLHERGRFGAWPRGADRSDTSKVIWGNNKTLAEFINSLDPGEYDLAT